MSVVFLSHRDCLAHDMGASHPECPERLRAIMAHLNDSEYAFLDKREAPLASLDTVKAVHDGQYVEQLLAAVPGDGRCVLDPDTSLSPGSGNAILRAAGAVIAGVDAIYAENKSRVFCAVRPPGHHAEHHRAMGFCFFNNVAIAARYAQKAYYVGKVAIVDFDVHHGNGTQDIFENDASVLYASCHQMPLYPGSGRADETGAAGNILNAPMPAYAGSKEFRKVLSSVILPKLTEFAPELLLISAGFDAHEKDPLAQLCLTTQDYSWVTEQLVIFAENHCQGRILSTLEGGYHLSALVESVGAHAIALNKIAGEI